MTKNSDHGLTSERGISGKLPETAKQRAGISEQSGAKFYESVWGEAGFEADCTMHS